jgi:uncharacterized protein YvpB
MRRWIIYFIISGLVGVWIAFWFIPAERSKKHDEALLVEGTQDGQIVVSLQSLTPMTPTWTPFQPNTDTPTLSQSPSRTPTPEPSKTPFPTSTATPQPSATATMTPTPLKAASIDGITGHWPAYSLNCEARSAVDWAGYFGYQIDEITFYTQLPVSDDPDLGFVGSVHEPWGQTPPNGYGVHADPVAALLQDYGLNALSVHGMTWNQIKAEISQERPVIVWVVGRVGRGTPISYTSSGGNETVVARFEHTVILTGYTQSDVTVLDGYWVYTRPIQDFISSWDVLGNMAVIWSDN